MIKDTGFEPQLKRKPMYYTIISIKYFLCAIVSFDASTEWFNFQQCSTY